MALPSTDTSAAVTIKTHNNSVYGQNMTVGQVLCMPVSVTRTIGDYTPQKIWSIGLIMELHCPIKSLVGQK